MAEKTFSDRCRKFRADVGTLGPKDRMRLADFRAAQAVGDFDAEQVKRMSRAVKTLDSKDELALQMKRSDEERTRQMYGLFIGQIATGMQHGGLDSGTVAYLAGMAIAAGIRGLSHLDPMYQIKTRRAERREQALNENARIDELQRRVDEGKTPWRLPIGRKTQMWYFDRLKAENEGRLSSAGFRSQMTPDTVGNAMVGLCAQSYKDALAAGSDPDKLMEIRREFLETRVAIYKIAADDGMPRQMVDDEIVVMACERLRCDENGQFDASGKFIRVGESPADRIHREDFERFMEAISGKDFGTSWAKHLAENEVAAASADNEHGSEPLQAEIISVEDLTEKYPRLKSPSDKYLLGDDQKPIDLAAEAGIDGSVVASMPGVVATRSVKSPEEAFAHMQSLHDENFTFGDWTEWVEPERFMQLPAIRPIHKVWNDWLVAVDHDAISDDVKSFAARDAVQTQIHSGIAGVFGTKEGPVMHMWLEGDGSPDGFAGMLEVLDSGGDVYDPKSPYFTDFVVFNRMKNCVEESERAAAGKYIVDELCWGLTEVESYRQRVGKESLSETSLAKWLERGSHYGDVRRIDPSAEVYRNLRTSAPDVFDPDYERKRNRAIKQKLADNMTDNRASAAKTDDGLELGS